MTTSTAKQKRHCLEITYTVVIGDEAIERLKRITGTSYWVHYDWTVDTEGENVNIRNPKTGEEHNFDTETALKGIALWVQYDGGDIDELRNMETDSDKHDRIWQYGFFGTVIYG